jgi:lipoate-protein ligase B
MSCVLHDLGVVAYGPAWQFQKEMWQKVHAGVIDSALIFCRHLPVVTLGRRSTNDTIKVSLEELRSRGIAVRRVERGGEATYHGPGQCTVYPIINLANVKKDLHYFLRMLEEVVIAVLADEGIDAQRKFSLTGVWVKDKKIASIGIAVKNWISYHGVSLNVGSFDLAGFTYIRPCGMDIEMTSVETELVKAVSHTHIKERFACHFNNLVENAEVTHGQGDFAGVR